MLLQRRHLDRRTGSTTEGAAYSLNFSERTYVQLLISGSF